MNDTLLRTFERLCDSEDDTVALLAAGYLMELQDVPAAPPTTPFNDECDCPILDEIIDALTEQTFVEGVDFGEIPDDPMMPPMYFVEVVWED